jgi:hypothetical protein
VGGRERSRDRDPLLVAETRDTAILAELARTTAAQCGYMDTFVNEDVWLVTRFM